MFILGRHAAAQFQIGGENHQLGDGQMGTELVALHDVARHFAESAQVAIRPVDRYASRYARNTVKSDDY